MSNYDKSIVRLSEHKTEVEHRLQQAGYELGVDYLFEGIYLQGSQNYKADHEHSDVDSKYVLVPTVNSLLKGTNFVRDITFSRNEKVSVKPFTNYVDLFFKGNVNNLEMLFTDYFISNPDLWCIRFTARLHGEAIAQATKKTMSNAIIGMMTQKQKSMYKGTETTLPFVEKMGYDPKDVQHIMRLFYLYEALFVEEKTFAQSIIVPDSFMDTVRKVVYSGDYKEAQISWMCEDAIEKVKELESEVKPENNPEAITKLRAAIEANYMDAYNDYLEEKYACTYCN